MLLLEYGGEERDSGYPEGGQRSNRARSQGGVGGPQWIFVRSLKSRAPVPGGKEKGVERICMRLGRLFDGYVLSGEGKRRSGAGGRS